MRRCVRPRGGRLERHGPVGGAQPDLGPGGRERQGLGGRLLVEPDGRLDRLHQPGGRLQPGHLRVRLRRSGGPLLHQVPQGAGPDALLPEAREDIGDVPQVGAGRADEQDPAAPVGEPGVGVQEVRGAVQGDDRLSRARPAVHHERAPGTRTDDGVLVGLDGAENVPHPLRPVAAEAGDERRLVVERGMPGDGVRVEHLVPVVADPATAPAVSAAAPQPHRVGVGGTEERLGGGGAPVDQQPAALAVGEAEPADVHRCGAVLAGHVPEAEIEPEAAQGAQAGGEPVDLRVPVHRLAARAAGSPALGVEAGGQLGDRRVQGPGDGREVLLVGGDQRRVGLGGEVVGEEESAGGEGVHGVRSVECL